MMLAWFDWTLLLAMAALAWRALNDRDLFRAVIKFIAFGLLLAVAWVRLRAPDVALAEAAVGSGLTGALILSALVRMRARISRRRRDAATANPGRRILAGSVSLALFGGLSWAVFSWPAQPAGLTEAALSRLPESGVSNPVTAVLLNYRGYDTLLEIGVLLLAIAGVWSLRRGEWPEGHLRDRPLMLSLLRLVLPVLVLAAGYLLWIGAFAPGGAFQGGALLGGGLVLALLGRRAKHLVRRETLLRWALALGVLVFAAVGAITLLQTGGLLQYPAGAGGAWILVIESAALISIGLTLGLLYLGGSPEGVQPHSHRGKEPDYA